MRTKNILIAGLCLCLLFIVLTADARAQNTNVKITDLRSGKGQVIVSVYKDSESYEKEHAYKQFKFDKAAVAHGTMSATLDIEPGVYGIAMVDDENKNGKIDKNLIGFPKEGFGFSNFFMTKLKKPSFDDFKVDLKSLDNQVIIKVKYL